MNLPCAATSTNDSDHCNLNRRGTYFIACSSDNVLLYFKRCVLDSILVHIDLSS